LISLRTLTENIVSPEYNGSVWQFEFDAVDPAAISDGEDPVGLLKKDCDGVPVAQVSDDLSTNMLKTIDNVNTWFEIVSEEDQLNIPV
jgi:hypothetical protein